MKNFKKILAIAATMTMLPLAAVAQNNPDNTIGEGQPSSTLPPSTSDDDAAPPVAAPVTPPGGVVRQAGIGGQTAYGRAGVLELGGSAFVTRAGKLTQINFSPSIGWFFMDNLQLSAILGINYSKVGTSSNMYFNALVEPSFHIPFSQQAFGFLGLGMGLSFVDQENAGAGFALAPRMGANIMVGRSGILTPSLNVSYSTHAAQTTPAGALLGVSVSYGIGMGYTVMW